MKYSIPDAALDDRLGFVGTAGAGKTYNAGGCIERLLDKGARVVIIDPLDVWWGIRLIADGQSPSRYSMPIFGGVCFFHFVGWSCISFGFHIDVASPNLEVHFPFGFVRIGWQGTPQWRERRAVGRLYLQ